MKKMSAYVECIYGFVGGADLEKRSGQLQYGSDQVSELLSN